MRVKIVERLAHRDRDRFLEGVTVDAAANCGKCNRLQLMRVRKPEARSIARREQFGFLALAAIPHWAGGMDHVSRRQPVAASDFGVAGAAAAEGAALGEQLGPSGAVDRAVDPAAAE